MKTGKNSRATQLNGTFLQQIATLIVVTLALAALTAFLHPKRPPWTDTPPGEENLSTILSWKKPILWIDARSEADFQKEHAPGALSLNLENWDQSLPTFINRWSPKFIVVVYCSSQSCDLSRQVAARLRDNHIANVYDLKGGWESLRESSLKHSSQ